MDPLRKGERLFLRREGTDRWLRGFAARVSPNGRSVLVGIEDGTGSAFGHVALLADPDLGTFRSLALGEPWELWRAQ